MKNNEFILTGIKINNEEKNIYIKKWQNYRYIA